MLKNAGIEDASKIPIFGFEPSEYVETYRANSFVHIPGGASPEFMRYALDFTESKVSGTGDRALRDWQFKGKKLQFLMDFPENGDISEDLYRPIAAVTDLDIDRMMMGERHIKIYESNAPEMPPPHKDRHASQVTVGIGLRIPPESKLILYPECELMVNPYQSTAQWRDSLDPEELPEKVLENVEPVEIDMRDGDVVMFAGSSIYHERTNPANVWVLYMKFNAMRLDPICEDPQTRPLRERSLELLAGASDEELLGMRIEVSPRLEKVTRIHTRQHWKEVLQGHIMGETPFTLSETEWAALRTLDDQIIPVRQLIVRMGFPPQRSGDHAGFLRRLVNVGAMDLHG